MCSCLCNSVTYGIEVFLFLSKVVRTQVLSLLQKQLELFVRMHLFGEPQTLEISVLSDCEHLLGFSLRRTPHGIIVHSVLCRLEFWYDIDMFKFFGYDMIFLFNEFLVALF